MWTDLIGVFLGLILGEPVSGSVVAHLDSAVLHQTADGHASVQISSLSRAVAAAEDTEVMSHVLLWQFSVLAILGS